MHHRRIGPVTFPPVFRHDRILGIVGGLMQAVWQLEPPTVARISWTGSESPRLYVQGVTSAFIVDQSGHTRGNQPILRHPVPAKSPSWPRSLRALPRVQFSKATLGHSALPSPAPCACAGWCQAAAVDPHELCCLAASVDLLHPCDGVAAHPAATSAIKHGLLGSILWCAHIS